MWFCIHKYNKQFFLYAKGWYKKSDNIFYDLSKLYAINYNLPADCIDKGAILNKMTTCAFECILEDSHSRSNTVDRFQSFLFDLLPENNWKFYAEAQVKLIPMDEAIIRNCLSIMMMAGIENLDPEKDCDFSILPSSRDFK